MLQTVDPLSLIELAVRPEIGTHTFWLSINILSIVFGTISKLLIAFAVFIIGLPVTLVKSTVMVDHNSFTMSFVIEHLAIIGALFITLQLEKFGFVHIHHRNIRFRHIMLEKFN
jgi:hypothetical protein